MPSADRAMPTPIAPPSEPLSGDARARRSCAGSPRHSRSANSQQQQARRRTCRIGVERVVARAAPPQEARRDDQHGERQQHGARAARAPASRSPGRAGGRGARPACSRVPTEGSLERGRPARSPAGTAAPVARCRWRRARPSIRAAPARGRARPRRRGSRPARRGRPSARRSARAGRRGSASSALEDDVLRSRPSPCRRPCSRARTVRLVVGAGELAVEAKSVEASGSFGASTGVLSVVMRRTSLRSALRVGEERDRVVVGLAHLAPVEPGHGVLVAVVGGDGLAAACRRSARRRRG